MARKKTRRQCVAPRPCRQQSIPQSYLQARLWSSPKDQLEVHLMESQPHQRDHLQLTQLAQSNTKKNSKKLSRKQAREVSLLKDQSKTHKQAESSTNQQVSVPLEQNQLPDDQQAQSGTTLIPIPELLECYQVESPPHQQAQSKPLDLKQNAYLEPHQLAKLQGKQRNQSHATLQTSLPTNQQSQLQLQLHSHEPEPHQLVHSLLHQQAQSQSMRHNKPKTSRKVQPQCHQQAELKTTLQKNPSQSNQQSWLQSQLLSWLQSQLQALLQAPLQAQPQPQQQDPANFQLQGQSQTYQQSRLPSHQQALKQWQQVHSIPRGQEESHAQQLALPPPYQHDNQPVIEFPSEPEGDPDGKSECESESQPEPFANRRKRGPTRCLSLDNLAEGEKAPILLNESLQPVGEWASTLAHYLGILVKDGLVPLHLRDWRKISNDCIDNVWEKVQNIFNIDETGKDWVKKALGIKVRDYRCILKAEIFSKYETYEEQLKHLDSQVAVEQWNALIQYWGSEEGKAKCEKNKANRAKLSIKHTAGSRSFAQVKHLETLKQPDLAQPSIGDVFKITHTRKNGEPVDVVSGQIMQKYEEILSELPEDSRKSRVAQNKIFKQTVKQIAGEDGHGKVRRIGELRKDVWARRFNKAEIIKERDEIKAQLEEVQKENSQLLNEVNDVKSLVQTMQTQMNTFMQVMQERLLSKDLIDVGASLALNEEQHELSQTSHPLTSCSGLRSGGRRPRRNLKVNDTAPALIRIRKIVKSKPYTH